MLGNTFAQPAVAFDDFSDFLGDVFRGITGQKKKKAVPVIRDLGALRRFPALPEKELEKRKVRLEAFASAQKNWIHTACELSAEQSTKYDELTTKRIATSQEGVKNGKNQRQRHGFADYAPARFTFSYGAVKSTLEGNAWVASIDDLLTINQVEKITAAYEERNHSLLEAQRDRIINILDEELFFTSKQRPLLAEQIEKRLSPNNDRLFSLTNQSYYLKYESPRLLLSGTSLDILNEAQKDRWSRVQNGNSSGAKSERYITFMSNNGVDAWYKTLDESMTQQAIRLTQAANVRIEYFAAEFELADKDVHHLKLAAKGTIIYCMQTWKKTAKQNLVQWEERLQQQQFGNGNFGFSVAVPSTKVIEQHELWKNTLSQMGVDSTDSKKDHVNLRRTARVNYIISLLDRELWLTPEQRDQFKKVLTVKLPKNDIVGYESMYEVVLLAIPAVKLSDADIKEILEPEQIVAWNALKGQYTIQGDRVTVNMQNQGQFSIRIPD